MKIFFKKIFVVLSPFILLLVIYIVSDPFKVVRQYDIYLSDYVLLHRGYVSTKVYLKNREEYNFDSFIFGSSRSCAHTSSDWEKYLPESSKAFSYGSWNERLIGILRKIQLLDSLNATINNAIIIVDDRTFAEASDDFLLKEHYYVSRESMLDFHLYYFTQYFDLRIILASIDYPIFKKQRKYMNIFQGMKPGDLDPVNNDWLRDKLPNDTIAYYQNSLHKFYERDSTQKYYEPKIDSSEIIMLKEMKEIFKHHNTNYKLVIAPLYDQKKIHPDDLKTLEELFGKQSVYDYSGINAITNSMYNYNDDMHHYRYKVGKTIYKEIYNNN